MPRFEVVWVAWHAYIPLKKYEASHGLFYRQAMVCSAMFFPLWVYGTPGQFIFFPRNTCLPHYLQSFSASSGFRPRVLCVVEVRIAPLRGCYPVAYYEACIGLLLYALYLYRVYLQIRWRYGKLDVAALRLVFLVLPQAMAISTSFLLFQFIIII